MSGLGNKEIMSKNIQYYMNKYGKSRQEICDAIGVKYTTFTDWVKGNTYPRIDKIELMANYFGVSKANLVEEHHGVTSSHGVKINVLGRVAAGIPIEAVADIIDTEEISEKMARTGDYFGLVIRGDSMEPMIYDGDIVIVRKQADANTGDIVISSVNNDPEATCKRLLKYAEGLSLLSINSKYAPMTFSQKEVVEKPVNIIGKVVEIRRKL